MIKGIEFKLWKKFYIKQKKKRFPQRYILNRLCAIESHKTNILPYLNMYNGKTIAIFGSGPTLKDYIPLENDIINMGVNNTYLKKDLELDYLFLQEDSSEIDIKAVLEYRKGKCKKFFGIISDSMYEYMKDYTKKYNGTSATRIPINYYKNEDVVPYFLEEYAEETLPYNIAYEPFGDWHGTIFSVLQFALYTNPKRIYIVGNDCGVGHFDEKQKDSKSNFTYNIKMWKKMKQYIDEYYPHIEIISVNPVGLRGLFDDIYTNTNENKK